MSLSHSDSDHDRFHTTHWSLVLAAGQRDAHSSAEALARLCADYWPPLYGYLRRCGHSVHAAQDLTQAFFARLLEKNYLQVADPERGRFRSFLLAALKHFLANRHKAERAQKRGGGRAVLPWDFLAAEEAYQAEPVDRRTPERLYDRQWAVLLLDRVLSHLEAEFQTQGKGLAFASLREFLTAGQQHRPYREVAAETGQSEDAVKMAVHRLRKRYRELLREEIAHTLADPAEVDDEVRQLFTILAETAP